MMTKTTMIQPKTAEKSRITLRYSDRRWLLVIPDLLILNGVMVATAIIVYAHTTGILAGIPRVVVGIIWSAVLTAQWLTMGMLMEIFDLRKAANPLRSAWEVGFVTLVSTLIFSLTPGISPGLPTRRLYLFLFPLLATIALIIWRVIYGLIFIHPLFSRKALIIGTGSSARAMLNALPRIGDEQTTGELAGIGYQLMGFIAIESQPTKQTIEGISVLGSISNLTTLVQAYQPDELIVAIDQAHLINSDLVDGLMAAREQDIDVTMMLDMFERLMGRIPVTHVGSSLHAILPIQRSISYRFYQFSRRLIDLSAALIGCTFLLFVIPFVWVANKVTAPGDLFYRQERVGEGGRLFYVLKFRSMIMDAEKLSGAVWAEENDPRITPAGRFFRRSRLDEVPQFWNILRGDMSFIGPRPERPHFVEKLAKQIPFYRARHAIKPGLTGWAQANYRYGASVEDSRMKLEYDLFYIKNQSLYLDIRTVLKTIQVVLGMRGR